MVLSFPDARKVLAGKPTQGFTEPTVSLNSVIYRYGHTFMYDAQIVSELLMRAGFKQAEEATFSNAPLGEYLDPAREPESCYIVASAS